MPTPASPPAIHVVSSGGITPAYQQLAPQYEKTTGTRLVSERGDSMGSTPTSIPNRLRRKEPLDLLLLVDDEFEVLRQQQQVDPQVRVALARSRIAVAVRAGDPKPDISTVEALKQTLLHAASIGYSDSASGHYLSTTLFAKLGIADAIKGKSRQINGTPVGQLVAQGDIALGFQELSELKALTGIDIVGLLPEEVQKITLYVGGIPTRAAHPTEAKALLAFLISPEAAAIMQATGLEPVTAPPK